MEQRLGYLRPELLGAGGFVLRTEALLSNDASVNHVHFHSVEPTGGMNWEVVEKSIRKLCLLPSLESRFYRHYRMLAGSRTFSYPKLYGQIETPCETFIYTQFIHGRRPAMARIAREIATGIAEIETLSRRYMAQPGWSQRLDEWQMDFFRPWFLSRPRFNFQRLLPSLERLARAHPELEGYARRLAGLRPALDAQRAAVRRSPRCISHLDYLKKNLFVADDGLYLIDWSSVKVGRIGFDGGAYLSNLLRRMDVKKFAVVRARFEAAYGATFETSDERAMAFANMRYLFMLNALWRCLRPETLDEYVRRQRLPLLVEKFDYLLAEPSRPLPEAEAA